MQSLKARNNRPVFHVLLALLAVGLLCLPWGFKAIWISRHIGHLTGDWWLGMQRVWLHDAVIVCSIVAGLFALSWVQTRRRWIVWPTMLSIALIYLLYCIDLIILFNFNNHLNLVDSQKYAGAALGYFSDLLHGRSALVLLICLLGLSGLWVLSWALQRCVQQPVWPTWRRICAGVALLLLGLGWSSFLLRGSEQYSHAWLYENVFEHQVQSYAAARAYSDGFRQAIQAPRSECQSVTPIAEKPKKIVILMLESWSSVHSQLFSGIHNWTPQLDQIAQQHRYYPQFYANGFTTEDGEIALLTGRFPLPPVGAGQADGGTSFQGFWQVEDSLPKILERLGYQRQFLTSSDLSFSQTGAWARQLGFSQVFGSDNPAFVDQQRFHFNSVPDAVLLDDAAQRILSAHQPSFYFIKTVSTHHPFIHPDTGEASQQAAFSYMDQSVAAFYHRLKQADFFQDGLLFIVGDHHAMVPLHPKELLHSGAVRAVAHVPLIVVDTRPTTPQPTAAAQAQLAQQIDVYHSLVQQLTGRDCQTAWHGVLWGAQQRPTERVLFRRGDRRDRLSILTQQADYSVQLNGDHTQIQAVKPMSPAPPAEMLQQVHAFRLGYPLLQTPLPKNSPSCGIACQTPAP